MAHHVRRHTPELPDDAVRAVLSFGEAVDAARAQAVCRRFRALAREEPLWHAHLQRDWAVVTAGSATQGATTPGARTSLRDALRAGVSVWVSAAVALLPPALTTDASRVQPRGSFNATEALEGYSACSPPRSLHASHAADVGGVPYHSRKHGSGQTGARSRSSDIVAPESALQEPLLRHRSGSLDDSEADEDGWEHDSVSFIHYKQRAQERAALRRSRAQARAAKRTRHTVAQCHTSAEALHLVGVGSPLTLLCGFALCLLLKLLGLMDTSWASVFAPLLAIPVLLVLDFGVSAAGQWSGSCRAMDDDGAVDVTADTFGITVYGCVTAFWHRISQLPWPGWRMFYFAVLWIVGMVAIPVVIMLKLDGVLDIPWLVAFTPVWLVCAMTLGVPLLCSGAFPAQAGRAEAEHPQFEAEADGDAPTSPSTMMVTAMMVVFAPLIALLVLAALRFEGVYIEAQYMFIPLWFLDSLLFIGCLSMLFMWASEEEDATQGDIYRKVALGLFVMLAITAPGEIYAAVYDHRHGELPVLAVMLPCVVFFAVLCAVGWYFAGLCWRRYWAHRAALRLALASPIPTTVTTYIDVFPLDPHVHAAPRRRMSTTSAASSVSLCTQDHAGIGLTASLQRAHDVHPVPTAWNALPV